jgi:hypothetical protein
MFRPFAIDRRLQCVRDRLGNYDRNQQTKNAGPRSESAKDECGKNNDEKKRLPNVGITDRGHEQIQSRARPSLIDKMKERLVHLHCG